MAGLGGQPVPFSLQETRTRNGDLQGPLCSLKRFGPLSHKGLPEGAETLVPFAGVTKLPGSDLKLAMPRCFGSVDLGWRKPSEGHSPASKQRTPNTSEAKQKQPQACNPKQAPISGGLYFRGCPFQAGLKGTKTTTTRLGKPKAKPTDLWTRDCDTYPFASALSWQPPTPKSLRFSQQAPGHMAMVTPRFTRTAPLGFRS